MLCIWTYFGPFIVDYVVYDLLIGEGCTVTYCCQLLCHFVSCVELSHWESYHIFLFISLQVILYIPVLVQAFSINWSQMSVFFVYNPKTSNQDYFWNHKYKMSKNHLTVFFHHNPEFIDMLQIYPSKSKQCFNSGDVKSRFGVNKACLYPWHDTLFLICGPLRLISLYSFKIFLKQLVKKHQQHFLSHLTPNCFQSLIWILNYLSAVFEILINFEELTTISNLKLHHLNNGYLKNQIPHGIYIVVTEFQIIKSNWTTIDSNQRPHCRNILHIMSANFPLKHAVL